MHSSSESQSRYLSLAIACRQLIRELQRYRETGNVDKELRASLSDLLGLLQEPTGERHLFGPIPTDSPFSRYEQLLTLREVYSDFREKHIEQKFLAVLEAPGEDIREPIDFFYRLENRALQRYNSGLLSGRQ
jgi:hypothetical protein